MMKNWTRAAAGAAIGLMAAAAPAADAIVDAGLSTHYIWRGQIENDEPVFQAGFGLSASNGLGLYAWMNTDLSDRTPTAEEDARDKPTEVDLTLSYKLPLKGKVGVEVGVNQYTYPHPRPATGSTRDAYVKAALDAPLKPTVTVYYDFDEVDDFYGTLGLEQDWKLAEAWQLALGASVGYAGARYDDYYFSVAPVAAAGGAAGQPGVDAGQSAFNDATGQLKLTWQATENVSFSATALYSALLDSTVREGAKQLYGDDHALCGCVAMQWTF